MKFYYVVVLVLGLGLMCFSQEIKPASQEKIDSIILMSRLKPEKLDATKLSPAQLKDIWQKQICEMYFIGEDGTLKSDKKPVWGGGSGWHMATNTLGLTKSMNLTVKRSVGEGLWLAEDESKQTIYVKPGDPNMFSEGLNTNLFLNMIPQMVSVESDSGVKLNVACYEVKELVFKRPSYKDFIFLLDSGKTFQIIFPAKITCPICNGTGSTKTIKKVGTRTMPVTEFCKTCNSRKTIEAQLLSTLAK